MMDVRPIRTEADHEWALGEIAHYFENEPALGTPEADRFDVLSDLVEAYERAHFPMPEIDPVEALAAFMESAGKTQADLGDLFGSRPRASEVLSRKRTLTIEMIHALHAEWGIPARLLIVPYKRAA